MRPTVDPRPARPEIAGCRQCRRIKTVIGQKKSLPVKSHQVIPERRSGNLAEIAGQQNDEAYRHAPNDPMPFQKTVSCLPPTIDRVAPATRIRYLRSSEVRRYLKMNRYRHIIPRVSVNIKQQKPPSAKKMLRKYSYPLQKHRFSFNVLAR